MSRQWPAHLASAALALFVVVGCGPAGPSVPPVSDKGAGGGVASAGQPLVPPTETIPPFEAVELPPVDESEQDPSFSQFHRRFQDAVTARDVSKLLTMVNPRIRIGFGDDQGMDAFRKAWKLDTEPSASPLWPLLSDILRLGGTFADAERTSFFAPYVFSRWPERFDAFEHIAITGQDVGVRVEPRLDAGVVERVSDLVVRRLQTGEEPARVAVDGRPYEWIKIGLPSGKVGWVLSRDAWSPVDYRAGFRRENGNWQMDFLVAGD